MLNIIGTLKLFILAAFMLTFSMNSYALPASGSPLQGTSLQEESDIEPGVDAGIDMNISYGYDNIAKGDRYLPLHIEYISRKDGDFTGRLGLVLNESDGKIYRYEYGVRLGPGETLKNDYCIPIAGTSSQIYAILEDADGEKLVSRKINLNINTDTAELIIGILSDTPERLAFFDSVSVNYGQLRSRAVSLSAESFPESRIELDQLDIIVISSYRIRNLNENQSRALMEWVRAGGIMLLGTGLRADDTLGRYAPELLDDMYDDAEPMQVNVETGDAKTGLISLNCINASVHGGNILHAYEGLPLITTVNKEKGMIAVAAYDFTEIADYAAVNKSYADSFLYMLLGSGRMNLLLNEVYGLGNQSYWEIEGMLNTGHTGKLPPLSLYMINIIAYILLAGPGMYLFLRQRGLTEYYRGTVLVLAAGFALIVYLMGGRTRFKNAFYNYATILDAEENTVAETTFLNIRSPYNREFTVEAAPEYNIVPVTRLSFEGQTESFTESVRPGISIAHDESETRIRIGDVGSFESNIFSLDRVTDNRAGAGFKGAVSIFMDRADGEVRNSYPYKITNTILLCYGKIAVLGDMEPGEAVKLENLRMYNIPMNMYYAVASKVTGLDGYAESDVSDPAYMRALDMTNLLSYYMRSYQSYYTFEARVIGFAGEPLGNTIFINDKFESSGINLLTSEIDTDNESGERIYRSVLMNVPDVLSGTYYPESNSMYSIEPVILEYYLGDDIDIEALHFETVSEEFLINSDIKSFNYLEGNIAFYNYDTGGYDYIDIRKGSLNYEELGSYISGSGSVTVKYSYDTESQMQWEVTLPMLSLTGREK